MPAIRFLERQDIDMERWDRCVRDSPHSDVYALSGWLDIMANRWSGLVQDDYTAVLPIPWNRKYFLSYIYTPRFTSPLPICGDPDTILPLADFLAHIPCRFVRWDLDISTPEKGTTFPGTSGLPGPLTETATRQSHHHRTNYLLSLGPGYGQLFDAFRPGYRNLIRQSQRAGFRVQRTGAYEEIIGKASMKKKIAGMKPEDYTRFRKLCDWLSPQDMLECWETIAPDGNRCAGAVFAKTGRRLYYLLAWNNDEGRVAAASHLLMDAVISNHAGSGLVLDFEGSDHPGIAHFIRGFGAIECAYIHVAKKPMG